MKVFLVEDAPLLRSRLETLIASIPGGRTIGHAEGADDAIAAILAQRPDVVVLDLHLRQGSGLDVLREIAKAGVRTAVYVLTNYPEESYRRLASKLGARGFFDKSKEFEKLRDALASATE
jgi:DNA-binding NarL/FixJ family response regulator